MGRRSRDDQAECRSQRLVRSSEPRGLKPVTPVLYFEVVDRELSRACRGQAHEPPRARHTSLVWWGSPGCRRTSAAWRRTLGPAPGRRGSHRQTGSPAWTGRRSATGCDLPVWRRAWDRSRLPATLVSSRNGSSRPGHKGERRLPLPQAITSSECRPPEERTQNAKPGSTETYI